MAADPIQELVHDHRELSGLLVAVHEALARVASEQSKLDDEIHEISDGIEAFREALLEHFAREQEGLLPFVVARLPAHEERVAELVAEHDRIGGLLDALVRAVALAVDAVDRDASLAVLRASLKRFDELYAAHTKSELAFLTQVLVSLSSDPEASARLRALLDEA